MNYLNARELKYYAQLHHKAMRNRRTIAEGLKWLDDNYTGDTRKAHRHQMEAESWRIAVELQLRLVYKDLLGRKRQQTV
jgi:hypothetical protein